MGREQEANDTAAALRFLGMTQVDVFGYSDGGHGALGLAPGLYDVLVGKVRQQVVALEGWTPARRQGITAPNLAIIGDADILTPEQALAIVRAIPTANLAILPIRDHIQLGSQLDWMLLMLEEFDTAPLPAAADATPAASFGSALRAGCRVSQMSPRWGRG